MSIHNNIINHVCVSNDWNIKHSFVKRVYLTQVLICKQNRKIELLTVKVDLQFEKHGSAVFFFFIVSLYRYVHLYIVVHECRIRNYNLKTALWCCSVEYYVKLQITIWFERTEKKTRISCGLPLVRCNVFIGPFMVFFFVFRFPSEDP